MPFLCDDEPRRGFRNLLRPGPDGPKTMRHGPLSEKEIRMRQASECASAGAGSDGNDVKIGPVGRFSLGRAVLGRSRSVSGTFAEHPRKGHFRKISNESGTSVAAFACRGVRAFFRGTLSGHTRHPRRPGG